MSKRDNDITVSDVIAILAVIWLFSKGMTFLISSLDRERDELDKEEFRRRIENIDGRINQLEDKVNRLEDGISYLEAYKKAYAHE